MPSIRNARKVGKPTGRPLPWEADGGAHPSQRERAELQFNAEANVKTGKL